MKANERENQLYKSGKRVAIGLEESLMFRYLEQFARNGQQVLDLGCGSGEISTELKAKGFKPFGIDFSEVAVQVAKEKGVDCEVGDLDQGIRQGDGSFDVVWAGDVVEHIFDPMLLLEEINRVLRDQGIFLCTIPYDLHLANRLRTLVGHSYQEPIYRTLRQCKHHTFFSEPLIDFMLDNAKLECLDKSFVLRIPKTQKRFVARHRYLNLMANAMIIVARKKPLGD